MKRYYCYTLRKPTDEIVYVGMTDDPKRRLYQHIHAKPGNGSGMGMFYGQKLWMHIEKEFEDKSVAEWYEGYLKYKLGFRDEILTDNQIKAKIGGKITGKMNVESGHMIRMYKKSAEARSTPILVYKKDTGEFVGEFKSQREASRKLNCNGANINFVLKGKLKSTGGYVFKYKN